MKVYVVERRVVLPGNEYRDELICIRRTKEKANKIADSIPNAHFSEWDTEYLQERWKKYTNQ